MTPQENSVSEAGYDSTSSESSSDNPVTRVKRCYSLLGMARSTRQRRYTVPRRLHRPDRSIARLRLQRFLDDADSFQREFRIDVADYWRIREDLMQHAPEFWSQGMDAVHNPGVDVDVKILCAVKQRWTGSSAFGSTVAWAVRSLRGYHVQSPYQSCADMRQIYVKEFIYFPTAPEIEALCNFHQEKLDLVTSEFGLAVI